MRATKQSRRRTGFTLVELAISLGVMGAIIGGIWTVTGLSNNNIKQQKFSEQLSTIVGNIRTAYANQPYFAAGLINVGGAAGMMSSLEALNVFPNDEVRVSGGTTIIDSPFGEYTNPTVPASPYNSLYVCGWKSSGGTNKCQITGGVAAVTPLFAVEVLLPPGNACSGAVMLNSTPATIRGLVAVYMNGAALTLPTILSTVITNCASQPVNIVDFVYTLQL